MKFIKISLIIPIHNGLNETKKSLKSLFRSINNAEMQSNVDVIIVDDGSNDMSSQWIAHHYPKIDILYGDGNLWWSGAVNIGINKAMQKEVSHILLFNNDNMVAVNYFSILAHSIVQIGMDSIIASKVFDIYPKKTLRYSGNEFDRKRSRYIKFKDVNEVKKVNSAGGMGVLIPSSVFTKVGLFDEKNFPQKCGDSDYFLRAENKQVPMYINPKCVVYNDNRTSGYKNNMSITDIMKSFSYPKGYANLLVEYKFYIKHSQKKLLGLYRVLSSAGIFVLKGFVKIIIGKMKK